MKCVKIEAANKLSIIERDKPVLKEGYAILKVLYGGICGSDLGTYKGTFFYSKYPVVPGHEFSAEIAEVGPNSLGLKPGMIVTANPYFNCGKCYACRRGHVNCCMANKTMGVMMDGAFAEYIEMPIERVYDGKGIPAKELAVVEPFAISYHAAKRAAVKPGERVLVVGAGTIGYLAAAAAKMLGAEVYISDISQAKLDYAAKLEPAGTILNDDNDTFAQKIKDITNGDGFDVCIEAVGLPSTFMNCIDAAAHRGRVVIVGIGKTNLDFFYSIIQTKELDIFGSRNALKEDFIELIDKVNAGEAIDLLSVVSKEYSFLEAERAFKETVSDIGGRLKVLLRF
ncbi:MAG: zinc-binding alcohol dehydrogenase family protein [Christensenellales bacterium]